MVDPKKFYRDFDQLLQKISSTTTKEGFVCSILEEIYKCFADTLHIASMRLYEDRGDEFVLVNKFKNRTRKFTRRISTDSDAVKQVLKHGSFIYDRENLTIDPDTEGQEEYAVPAAMLIRSPEGRWIAVFELYAGWEREEVIFSLNAIRSALNYRLFSEAIHTELEQAAQIQRSLLPQNAPPIPGYEVAARSSPTEIVGGDFYDFFESDDQEIFGLAIGDASGHGLPAALLVRDCVIGLRMGIARQFKMVHSLKKLNSVIYRSTYSSRFVSLFYGEIERDGHLIFVNAGHPAPFVVDGDEVQTLNATGLILGALPEITLHRSFAHMKPGSILVLFSDGIYEREDAQEEAYGIERLHRLVQAHQEKSPEEILQLIFDTLDSYGNHTVWEDDSSVVIVKRLED